MGITLWIKLGAKSQFDASLTAFFNEIVSSAQKMHFVICCFAQTVILRLIVSRRLSEFNFLLVFQCLRRVRTLMWQIIMILTQAYVAAINQQNLSS